MSANYIPPTSLETSLRPVSKLRQFTGKERDAESGLDYFGARYYGSVLGRFTSPDWSAIPQPVPYATLDDPQTLNLYVYVRNNPLAHPDVDGHVCDICLQAIVAASGFVATHPNVQNALDNLSGSLGLKSQVAAGGSFNVGPAKLSGTAGITSEVRTDGTAVTSLQVQAAATVNSVGLQGTIAARIITNGEMQNPLNDVHMSAKLAGSTPVSDNVKLGASVSDRVAVGPNINFGFAQASVQVTAGADNVKGFTGAVVDAVVNDVKAAVQQVKNLANSCPQGGCP